MARYLVVHEPREDTGEAVTPSDLRGLAEACGPEDASPRWLTAWSPDLNDDRIFTLWEAEDGDAIRSVLERFGFLDDMDSRPLRVQEWGPAEILGSGE